MNRQLACLCLPACLRRGAVLADQAGRARATVEPDRVIPPMITNPIQDRGWAPGRVANRW